MRLSSAARRAEILEAAVAEFADHGYHGARVEAIAARAGVTHPRVIQLFGSKQELFLAVVAAAFDRIEEAFARAVAAPGVERPFVAMGGAYRDLLADRSVLLVQLHAYAAAADAAVGAVVRARYSELQQVVARLSGGGPEEVRTFFSTGLVLTVSAAMRSPQVVADLAWATAVLRELPALTSSGVSPA